MSRPLFLALGAVLVVSSTLFAQGRCPFTPQMQVQVQVNWQRQTQKQNQFRTQAIMQQQMQQRAQMQRFNQMQMQRNNGFNLQRQQMVRQQPMNNFMVRRTPVNLTRIQTNTTALVRRSPSITRMSPNGGGRGICRNLTQMTTQRSMCRQTTMSTQQLQRLTIDRQMQMRRSVTTSAVRRPVTTVNRQMNTGQRRQVTNDPQRRFIPTTTRTTTTTTQHRPNVQLRITMQNKCSGCHNCTQRQPTINRLPPRMPFLQQRLPVNPFDRLVQRPAPRLLLPQPIPQPRLPLLVVQLPAPRPAVLRPPTLPPLGFAQPNQPSKPSLESLLAQKPVRSALEPQTPRALDRAEKPRQTKRNNESPKLPALRGTVVSLSPLLDQVKADDEPTPTTRVSARLDPQTATAIPPLPALNGAAFGIDLRLLPGLDGKSMVEPARPAPVELVLRAPDFPPLPE